MTTTTSVLAVVREEWLLGVSAGTSLVFLVAGERLLGDLSNPWWTATLFLWLFAVVLWSALAVVRHADCLAATLGEPYGTLILTLSAISIEVMMIATMMRHGENNPTLARDTMFAVVMIILNGMVGLSLLLGGLRHREQHYNLQGANAYLSVLIPLAVLGLIMPNYTVSTPGPTYSPLQEEFLILMSVGLYGAFLLIQTTRHRSYFVSEHGGDEGEGEGRLRLRLRPMPFHTVLLAAYLLPVVFLAEKLALPLDYGIEMMGVPQDLAGVAVAVLVATPEAIGAVKAALANRMQRSVNIFLGSVLSTIGLTIPAVLAITLLTGKTIILGLQNSDFVMLLLTLTVSVVTFASGRSNILQGAVHLLLFMAYLLLIFER